MSQPLEALPIALCSARSRSTPLRPVAEQRVDAPGALRRLVSQLVHVGLEQLSRTAAADTAAIPAAVLLHMGGAARAADTGAAAASVDSGGD